MADAPRNPGQEAEHTLRRVTVAVAITPLLLVSAILFYAYDIIYRGTVLDHLRTQALRHAQIIDRFLEERAATLRLEAHSVPVSRLADTRYLEARLTALNDAFGPMYTDLGLIDPQGRQVAYAGPPQFHRTSYADAPWFALAKDQETFVSDVALGARRSPHFFVTARLWDAEKRPWLLRAAIDFGKFNARVREIRLGRTGKAFIINRRGAFQTDAGDASSLPPNVLTALVLRDLAADQAIVLEGDNTQGIASLACVAPLKGGQWLLILQQERFDALRPLYLARIAAVSTVTLGIIAIITVIHLVAGRMERRLGAAYALQERLQQQIVEKSKLAAIGELAAGVAHEINNPVAIMMENAGWIADLLEGDDLHRPETLKEIRNSVQEITTQGRRCREITHNLLSFARKTNTAAQPVELAPLIQEIASLIRARVYQRGMTLTLDLHDTPPVRASATEIQQVLLNLLNNAMDAIDHDHGAVVVRLFSQEGHAVIEVEDNGQGIAPEHRQRIFEPFFTTKPVGKGTGLGLAICYGIVRNLDGDLEVESEPGRGTTFRIRIPKAPQA